jgi:hypothetical protein
MNASNDDWKALAGDWKQQPLPDVVELQRRTRRKRLQMRFVLAFECITSLFALSQVVWLLFLPAVPLRWKIWAIFALTLIVAIAYLSIRVRRGAWRALGDSVPDLLRLTARRARSGIRLAWVNILAILALLAVTIPVAAPWLAPSRWLHDPGLRVVLSLQLAISGPMILGGLAFFAVYIRRQHRRLHEAEEMLRDYSETATS